MLHSYLGYHNLKHPKQCGAACASTAYCFLTVLEPKVSRRNGKMRKYTLVRLSYIQAIGSSVVRAIPSYSTYMWTT